MNSNLTRRLISLLLVFVLLVATVTPALATNYEAEKTENRDFNALGSPPEDAGSLPKVSVVPMATDSFVLSTALASFNVGGVDYWIYNYANGGSNRYDSGPWNASGGAVHSTTDGEVVYCLQPSIAEESGTHTRDDAFWEHYTADAKLGVAKAMTYGAPNNGDTSNNALIATAILVWDMVTGQRDSSGNLTHGLTVSPFIKNMGSGVKAKYNEILDHIQNHTRIPSFAVRYANQITAANTIKLTYNASTGLYEGSATDTNNILADYNYTSSISGLTFARNGNTLKVTATAAAAAQLTAGQNFFAKGHYYDVTADVALAYKLGDSQRFGKLDGRIDPVSAYIRLQVDTGALTISKTSEDGKVDGVRFRIEGNGVNQTVTTANGGRAQIDGLQAGSYTVTEQTEDRYNPQESRSVTITAGQTTTTAFHNTLKRGTLTVTKTSEDGLVSGVRFHLYGTSLSGAAVNEYATTDGSGVATFRNILIGSGYTLEEVDTAIRYVIPDAQTTAIQWNQVANKAVVNRLKKFNVTVTKRDGETGTPQGDATLAGAVYGLYKGGELIATYTTDADGKFTTDYYACGDDWRIQEITPSEGYLLDPASYPVGASAASYTVEYNAAPAIGSQETVKKGKIGILKHTNDGQTQLETPEVGATFQVYLKSAGSYSEAKESERALLIADNDGYAETGLLPYGVYVVHQTYGWEGRSLLPDFEVYISEDGRVYRFVANNAPFDGYLRIIKTDAETGKAIPYAGAGFQIYDPDGKLVTMTLHYPEITVLDTFYTAADGRLLLPDPLPYGTGYSLVEVQAPYGYVLNSEPVSFDVTPGNASEEDGLTVVTVRRPDMPQKGIIRISKTGEVFSSVTESDGVYQPIYEIQGLAGAVYEITAAEDIYTPDGTLRYSKGTVVDTVTTTARGAASKALYLGKYEIRETKAPYGMVLNEEIRGVELTYAGQEIEITDASASFTNERQRVQIDLVKAMEQDETFGIGANGEILAVRFGLFAAEALTATDGKTIPEDGLIEVVSCDEEGKATFATDVPVGAALYVKELVTDSHYILPDTKYPVVFEYAGQDTATVSITVNDGDAIKNEIVYGTMQGMKIDRETEEAVAGALFGLFREDETEFTEETAIMTMESDQNGVFTFESIPYGRWIIVELRPAEGFLPNAEVYPVEIDHAGQVITITAINDRIPEIGTTASVEGEKEINATEVFTLEDIVSYKHLIPGKEYVLKGVLMDKTTGEALLIDGKEIRSEVTFVPEAPSGEVVVSFIFDARYIKADTAIVAFESLYKDGIELTVHADIEDEGQTVHVHVPQIGTQAAVDGKKEVPAEGEITITDTVSYKNLTPGKEYIIQGVLMDKATGKPFLVNGKEIRSEVKFTPEAAEGEVTVTFTFDAGSITRDTDVVVFESLLRDGMEIAVHADIEDKGQTVTIHHNPRTGDNSLWPVILAGSVGLLGLAATGASFFPSKYGKRKKAK